MFTLRRSKVEWGDQRGVQVYIYISRKTNTTYARVWKPRPSCRAEPKKPSLIQYFLVFVQTSSWCLFLLIRYYRICKMLYSQLTFVLLLVYSWLYIQFSIQQGYESFPFNRGMKATVAKGICFCQFVDKWRYCIIWTVDRGCKKIFKITLNHNNMQTLFVFPIILLFHPNNEDRQNLKIELTIN